MSGVLEPPCSYGKYELLESIGSGGMAEVYRASMPGIAGFAKTVVIKRLRPSRARDEHFRDLFIEEAKLAAQVQHKNVVQVFELGSLGDEELFMAMEWVDGIDLRRLQRLVHRQGKVLPPWFSLRVMMEVLEALAFAYDLEDRRGVRRNVVHCDVAPDNIFIARSGDVKLGDFGVATDDTRGPKRRSGFSGKAPYAAPEVLGGARPGPRADVFSAGVVLWECLTGHRLFFADSDREAMSRVCVGDRPPPSSFAPDIPPMLDALVLQALEAHEERRIPSALKFRDALAPIYERLCPTGVNVHMPAAIKHLIGDEDEWSAIPLGGVALPRYEPVLEIDDDDVEDVFADEDEPEPPPSTDDIVYSYIRPRDTADLEGPAAPVEIPMPARLPPPRIQGPSCAVPTAEIVAPIEALPGDRETHEVLSPIGYHAPGTLTISHALQTTGPIDAIKALSVLEELAARGFGTRADVSGDGRRWMTWQRYLELLDESLVLPSGKLPVNMFSGSLEQHSLTALFGQLARTKATGRLIVVRNATGGVTRFEVHVRDGELMRVRSNHRAFDAFQMLIELPELRPTTLAVELQQVANFATPLADLASYDVHHALHRSRGRRTQELLTELFSWSSGQFGFQPDADVATGSGRPLLRVLVGLVSRVLSPDMLRARIRDLWHVPLMRTPVFHTDARALGLGAGFASPVGPFGQGRTLVEALSLAAERSDENVALAVAYLLVELGLVRPANQDEVAPSRPR